MVDIWPGVPMADDIGADGGIDLKQAHNVFKNAGWATTTTSTPSTQCSPLPLWNGSTATRYGC